jgi:hypothetical protein
MLYDDGRVALDDAGVTIRHYYLWGAKRVRYSQITSVEERPLTPVRGRWRIWGSGDLRHWYNRDRTRPTKAVAFDLHLGGWAIPVITPDEPDAVRGILASHVDAAR